MSAYALRAGPAPGPGVAAAPGLYRSGPASQCGSRRNRATSGTFIPPSAGVYGPFGLWAGDSANARGGPPKQPSCCEKELRRQSSARSPLAGCGRAPHSMKRGLKLEKPRICFRWLPSLASSSVRTDHDPRAGRRCTCCRVSTGRQMNSPPGRACGSDSEGHFHRADSGDVRRGRSSRRSLIASWCGRVNLAVLPVRGERRTASKKVA
jgi:hypothetical protein